MGKILDMRRTMGSQEVLPHGTVLIEYLESTGIQYIDTGIKPTNRFKIDLELAKTSLNRNDGICGSYNGSQWGMYLYFTNYGQFACAYGTNNIYITGANYNNTNKHHVILDLTSGGLETSIDNHVVSVNPYSPINNNTNYYIFRCNDKSVGTQRVAAIKIYYFKIYDNDTLVRDLIPVRIGQVGYMYDKVSKQLFGNVGTGAFVLGADKVGGGKYLIINMLCDYSAERRVA